MNPTTTALLYTVYDLVSSVSRENAGIRDFANNRVMT